MPRRSAKAPLLRLGAAVVLALLTQLLLLLFIATTSSMPVPHASRLRGPERPVSYRSLSPESFAKNRGANAPELAQSPPAKAQAKPKPKPEETPKGQVVAVPKGNEQKPEESAYLAESNNRVEKQSKAKETTAFYKNAMSQRTAKEVTKGDGDDAVAAPQVAGNSGTGFDQRPPAETTERTVAAVELPDVKAKSEVALKQSESSGVGVSLANRLETEAVRGNSDRFKVQLGESGATAGDDSPGHVGQPGTHTLLPSNAVVDRLVGAAANDHLDVDQGAGTYLNTREWKYAGFFNRVKQSVSQHWRPGDQLRLRDPTGQMYGSRDRYTLLTVTLDANGRLRDAFVEKSSGLDFLDVEAMKAFERATPFPNPPPGLVTADGTVRFQFGFMLELSGRPDLKLFRAND